MLALLLKILTILGILLLWLFLICLLLLLLMLFFPVVYRLRGSFRPEGKFLLLHVKWLFGLVSLVYSYPEKRKLQVRLLGIRLFQEKKRKNGTLKEEHPSEGKSPEGRALKKEASKEDSKEEKGQERAPFHENAAGAGSGIEEAEDKSFFRKKYEKIVYTFKNIYDKIKYVWDNISYYWALMQHRDTLQLFQHTRKRAGRILKIIRPRKLKADILFGTGSPDTTGYACGLYGILSPMLGGEVVVTPDFTQAVLEGNISASGHIMAFRILWNALCLLLDKNLYLFISRLKAERSRNGG